MLIGVLEIVDVIFVMVLVLILFDDVFGIYYFVVLGYGLWVDFVEEVFVVFEVWIGKVIGFMCILILDYLMLVVWFLNLCFNM